MDAAGLAALVSPLWFQQASDGGAAAQAGAASLDRRITGVSASASSGAAGSSTANVYDWILQFNTASLVGIDSVAQAESLLVGGGVNFQVLHGSWAGRAGLGPKQRRVADAPWKTACSTTSNLASFEEDAVRQAEAMPNDPKDGSLWALSSIDAQAAWNVSTGSSQRGRGGDRHRGRLYPRRPGRQHLDESRRRRNGQPDGFAGDVHGYNFVDGNGNPMDNNGHGTHVAGTIGAVGNNGLGVTGVNWSVSIMPLKFLNANGTGNLSDAVERDQLCHDDADPLRRERPRGQL